MVLQAFRVRTAGSGARRRRHPQSAACPSPAATDQAPRSVVGRGHATLADVAIAVDPDGLWSSRPSVVTSPRPPARARGGLRRGGLPTRRVPLLRVDASFDRGRTSSQPLGACPRSPRAATVPIPALAYSPDGKLLSTPPTAIPGLHPEIDHDAPHGRCCLAQLRQPDVDIVVTRSTRRREDVDVASCLALDGTAHRP